MPPCCAFLHNNGSTHHVERPCHVGFISAPTISYMLLPYISAINRLAMNLVSLTMQFPVLSMTQIPRRQKAVLLGLFALGLFITIIQIFRIQTVKNLVNYVNSATLVMWCTIENNLAIVVICNPPLRPLVKYFAGKSSSARRSAGNGSMVAGKNGLRFELQAWRTAKAGLYPLGSGVDRISESHIGAGGSGDISSSRDFTLDRSAIVKRTEITTFSSEC